MAFKHWLEHPAPWSKRTINWFRVAGLVTLAMVVVSYLLLFWAIQGKVAIWAAFGGEGVALAVIASVVAGALSSRRRDVQKHGQNQP
jgi:hypothetical protein